MSNCQVSEVGWSHVVLHVCSRPKSLTGPGGRGFESIGRPRDGDLGKV